MKKTKWNIPRGNKDGITKKQKTSLVLSMQ